MNNYYYKLYDLFKESISKHTPVDVTGTIYENLPNHNLGNEFELTVKIPTNGSDVDYLETIRRKYLKLSILYEGEYDMVIRETNGFDYTAKIIFYSEKIDGVGLKIAHEINVPADLGCKFNYDIVKSFNEEFIGDYRIWKNDSIIKIETENLNATTNDICKFVNDYITIK